MIELGLMEQCSCMILAFGKSGPGKAGKQARLTKGLFMMYFIFMSGFSSPDHQRYPAHFIFRNSYGP